MVNQREPPRPVPDDKPKPKSPLQDRTNEPAFGKASPIRNPLKPAANIFNVPKPGHKRPEHHRPFASRPSSTSEISSYPAWGSSSNPLYINPSPAISISSTTSSPDLVEIPRPDNYRLPPISAAPRQIFSTADFSAPINAFRPVAKAASSTRQPGVVGDFDPDRMNHGGSFDPTNFMDSAKANESIKALLEGAFDEDEDDKPRTRLETQKRTEAAAANLADSLQGLQVGDKQTEAKVSQNIEEDDGVVDGLKVKLLPHQIDGVAWMLDKELGKRKKNGVLPNGGILADDMGLGKTIQALALILSNQKPAQDSLATNSKSDAHEPTAKATLVVAPLALIKQWESEIKDKVLPELNLKVLVHHGPTRTKNVAELKGQDIVVTTYQTLTSEHEASFNDAAGCFGVHWYRIILDEAHSIKNRNAKMSKAAYALRSTYKWCLTGTPMQNNLDELQSLIRFLNISPWNDLKTWREQIIKPMKNGRGGLAMKRLQYFLKAFMKRRTKDVLKRDGALNFGKVTADNSGEKQGFKIVARNVQTVVVQFGSFERDFYNKLEARTNKNLEDIIKSDKTDYIGALVLLLRLRQTCNHPELSRANLSKEKEALPAGAYNGTLSRISTPSKPAKPNDMDDIANLLGSLTVETKKCDSCGTNLSTNEKNNGAIRCDECTDDFENLRKQTRSNNGRGTKICSGQTARQKRAFRSRRIVESDDEDDTADESETHSSEQEQDDVELKEDLDSETELDGSSTAVQPRASDSHALISSTKVRHLIKILEEESDEHKFIVFSEFTSMLDIIEPFLRQHGFRFTRYDGKMKNDDREASLDRLRNDSKTRILLCSLRCGSLGLNLTAASRVVLMEPFWNPFVEEQAIDRVHRLNQTQDVTVYRLTVADSVEQRILDLQQRKRELANAAIEGGKAVAKLSMQDILRLFKRDAEVENHEEDAMFSALGPGTPGSVLRGNGQPLQVASPLADRAYYSTQQQSPTRDRGKQRPKFQIPPSLQAEYDALNRWR